MTAGPADRAVWRTRTAVLGTALVSGAATVSIALISGRQAWHHRPALHVALETAASLIALLAAFLIVGRLRRRTLLDELMLVCGFAVLALSNLLFVTGPELLPAVPRGLTSPASLAGSTMGALLFCFAAFAPRRRLDGPGGVLAAGAAAVTAAGLLTAALLASFLPPRSIVATMSPSLHAHSGRAGVQLVLAVLYGLAVTGFLRRARQFGDKFLGWLAVAAVLACAARVNYFLSPAVVSGTAFAGEAFRLSSYAVLLVASMREIFSYWAALSEAAVVEERHRIARDLHDGLAQELAYLVRNLEALSVHADQDVLGRLRLSAERARLESRRAVRALATPTRQALDVALAEAAGDITDRFDVEMDTDFVADVRLTAAREETLVRIACEALTNAARHSGAHRVRLSLTRDGPCVRLRVTDSGRGFDTDVPGSAAGFGLISMRERACSIGADLLILSSPGRGTDVQVTL
jgi:signal transduction histidine kinase